MSASLFDVFCAYDNVRHHWVYSERKGGKGPNEVISMLHDTLEPYDVFGIRYANVSDKLSNDTTVKV